MNFEYILMICMNETHENICLRNIIYYFIRFSELSTLNIQYVVLGFKLIVSIIKTNFLVEKN